MSLPLILAAAAAAASPAPNDYSLGQNWLCRPGRRDACSTPNLDVSDIAPDGTITIRKSAAAADPKADCFYVYPTLSYDQGGNSDMIANDEERRVVETQFARFREQCRTFAPLYRQSTLTWLRSNMAGKPIPVDLELRYIDVRDAWRHYLANDNNGRPFVLVGHSQGSGLLKRLIAEEIDGKPVQKQMLSAMLAGHNVLVADGMESGGDFKSVPLCRKADQNGCALSWVTFRAASPPPANARFARADKAGMWVACTNPAQLAGRSATLRAVLPSTNLAGDLGGVAQPWTREGKPIATRFVSLPGLYSGQCVSSGGANYLAAALASDPADGRIDDPGGDVKLGPAILPDWGLHLLDVNLVLEDMVALVGTQSAAWARANRR
jgi:hypothetical protein